MALSQRSMRRGEEVSSERVMGDGFSRRVLRSSSRALVRRRPRSRQRVMICLMGVVMIET